MQFYCYYNDWRSLLIHHHWIDFWNGYISSKHCPNILFLLNLSFIPVKDSISTIKYFKTIQWGNLWRMLVFQLYGYSTPILAQFRVPTVEFGTCWACLGIYYLKLFKKWQQNVQNRPWLQKLISLMVTCPPNHAHTLNVNISSFCDPSKIP